ncbi:MAG: sigma factor-like helix-turn-helix DNA-binding protein, partial [Kangiellaceae bacterium]
NSQEIPLDSNATSNNYSSAENNNLKVIALRKAIADLPFDQKNTLLLKMDNGLSIDQIAEITGCKKEAVKSRLRYATSKLKQLLQSKMHSQSEVF